MTAEWNVFMFTNRARLIRWIKGEMLKKRSECEKRKATERAAAGN